MGEKMKAAFFNDGDPGDLNVHVIDRVYTAAQQKQLAELTALYPEIISTENFNEHVENLRDLDVIFSTWGMPELSGEQIDQFPNLKAVLYAGGATRNFRGPFLERGIKVCSATAANAIPVAEFSLAQVLLAGAGFFRSSRECVDHHHSMMCNSFRGFGNYKHRVSILGNGTISNRLQEHLTHHDLNVVVVPSRVENRTVSLEEAFSTSMAVVNLFPDRDDNVGIFNEPLFRSMISSAVFINVGRGRQVNEADLIQVMKDRPDLTALLDVQYPEPPEDGSELYTVPNILLSPHIAGSKAAELSRMSDYMIDDFLRLQKREPLQHEVQPDWL